MVPYRSKYYDKCNGQINPSFIVLPIVYMKLLTWFAC